VKKPVLVGILIFASLIALIAFSTMNMAKARVEVCINFNGRSACQTAGGSTREFALRKATSNACSELSSGVTEVLACEHTDPTSTTWK
jgi:hypothetical protein